MNIIYDKNGIEITQDRHHDITVLTHEGFVYRVDDACDSVGSDLDSYWSNYLEIDSANLVLVTERDVEESNAVLLMTGIDVRGDVRVQYISDEGEALENHGVDIQSELLDCKWSFNRRMGYAIQGMLDIYLDIGEYVDAGVGGGLVVPVHSVREKLDNDC